MTKEEALKEQNKLSLADIALSIENYSPNRENSKTKRYFIYKENKYPIMNVLKEAISISNQRNNKINSMGYNNINACIETLEQNICNIKFI
ncbi:MAG: hypothetical protein KAQ94_07825 [Arcobacteraceae bacterium]|nr:hypothetical protein [Arcobacteraceae bacterium]